MNDIPTPRTDAESFSVAGTTWIVTREFAQKLERELTTLIELGERLKNADSGEIHEAMEEWDKFIEEIENESPN